MLVDFDPGPRDPRTEALLGEIPPDGFDDHFFRCSELVDRYALDHALGVARALGLEDPLAAGGATAAELARRLGFVAEFRPALEWVLERLAAAGQLAIERPAGGGAPRYRLGAPLRPAETAELRRLGLALDAGLAGTLDLFDAAAAAYPAIARGETTAEQELLAGSRAALWLGYFRNENKVYGVSNHLAAVVAANRLAGRRGARILELGAGGGSGTEALLAELERRGALASLAAFEVTEPSPFFRRRAERELAPRFPGAPLRFAALDIDRDPAAQGFAATGFDLVLAVNVLHVAKNLRRTLGRLAALLAPGGWIVAGEAMRLFPGQPLPAELVFRLLRSYNEVEIEPGFRPAAGFLEPGDWRRAFAATGLAEAAVVPDLERIRHFYPRFFAGVVAGRRAPV